MPGGRATASTQHLWKSRRPYASSLMKLSWEVPFTFTESYKTASKRGKHSSHRLYLGGGRVATWYFYSAHARRSGDGSTQLSVEVSSPILQLYIYIPPMHGGRATVSTQSTLRLWKTRRPFATWPKGHLRNHDENHRTWCRTMWEKK